MSRCAVEPTFACVACPSCVSFRNILLFFSPERSGAFNAFDDETRGIDLEWCPQPTRTGLEQSFDQDIDQTSLSGARISLSLNW